MRFNPFLMLTILAALPYAFAMVRSQELKYPKNDFLIVPDRQLMRIHYYGEFKEAQQVAKSIIKESESFRTHAYPDGCKKRKHGKCILPRYSIGYGTEAKNAHEVITEPEGLVRFRNFFDEHVHPYVLEYARNDAEYIWLADIVYNTGPAVLPNLYRNGKPDIEFYRTYRITCNGKKCNGLINRRNDRIALLMVNK